jgi:hypothetical protein
MAEATVDPTVCQSLLLRPIVSIVLAKGGTVLKLSTVEVMGNLKAMTEINYRQSLLTLANT